MAEPSDMIVPMLREMRAEGASLEEQTRAIFGEISRRFATPEAARKSAERIRAAEQLMLRFAAKSFEERIRSLEQRVRSLEHPS